MSEEDMAIQSQANIFASAMIVASADSQGEFVTGDDGFVIYWPKGCYGAFAAWHLRAIADELDRRNAEWEARIREYFDGGNHGG